MLNLFQQNLQTKKTLKVAKQNTLAPLICQESSKSSKIIFELASKFKKENHLEISKIAIMKHYEQMLFKTFYFSTPIFVELLQVYGRLHEFSQIFIKCLSTPNKFPKTYWFLKRKQKKTEKDLNVKGKRSPGGYRQKRHRLL